MIRRTPRSTRTDTSFPTRRSSDLERRADRQRQGDHRGDEEGWSAGAGGGHLDRDKPAGVEAGEPGPPRLLQRSEEHTSELQSLMRISYAVFCLKKKKQ